jgi:hypothetical protein
MPVYVKPIVDDNNPLYCPAIPADLYLKSLRGRFNKSGWSHRRGRPNLFQSFARTLEQSTRSEDSDDDDDTIGSDWILGNYYASHKKSLIRRQHLQDFLTGDLDDDAIQGNYLASPTNFQSLSLKRKLCFSDLGAPPKYARSQPSYHNSSFDVEVQHEKLEYFSNTMESSPQKAPPQHSRVEKLDIEILADRLDSTLPGIRLRERLFALTYRTPEAFMDFMSENGKSLLQ